MCVRVCFRLALWARHLHHLRHVLGVVFCFLVHLGLRR
jgi:hypothetical protein